MNLSQVLRSAVRLKLWLQRRVREKEMASFLGSLELPTGARVLEVGCGVGFQALTVLRYTSNVIAVDLTKDIMWPKIVNFIICDGRALPFRDRIFDLTYCSNVLEHVVNRPLFLSEVGRVTKTGGSVLIIVPNLFWKLFHIYFIVLTFGIRAVIRRTLRLSALLPTHGVYSSHTAEVAAYKRRSWQGLLNNTDLHLKDVLYGRLHFLGIEVLLPETLRRKGISSQTAFHLKKN